VGGLHAATITFARQRLGTSRDEREIRTAVAGQFKLTEHRIDAGNREAEALAQLRGVPALATANVDDDRAAGKAEPGHNVVELVRPPRIAAEVQRCPKLLLDAGKFVIRVLNCPGHVAIMSKQPRLRPTWSQARTSSRLAHNALICRCCQRAVGQPC
jgi:hypothetical protein